MGTNNVREEDCTPADLAKNMFSYVKKVSTVNATTHVYLPETVETNSKIKIYNYYLKDMCSDLPRVHFIDNHNFISKDGKLVEKFSTDNLHLNRVKVYFSRIKYALRERHGLPNRRVRRTPRDETTSANRDSAESRGGRGRGTGRGGRGRNNQ